MRARRMEDGAAPVKIHLVVVLAAHRDTGLWRKLHVQPRAPLVLAAGIELVDVEAWERAVIGDGLRLALVFVVAEKVDPVLPDRPTKSPAQLLIRVRED